jgi:hypothetical protein
MSTLGINLRGYLLNIKKTPEWNDFFFGSNFCWSWDKKKRRVHKHLTFSQCKNEGDEKSLKWPFISLRLRHVM